MFTIDGKTLNIGTFLKKLDDQKDYDDCANKGMFFFENAKLSIIENVFKMVKTSSYPAKFDQLELSVFDGKEMLGGVVWPGSLEIIMQALCLSSKKSEETEEVEKPEEPRGYIRIHIPDMPKELKELAQKNKWNIH